MNAIEFQLRIPYCSRKVILEFLLEYLDFPAQNPSHTYFLEHLLCLLFRPNCEPKPSSLFGIVEVFKMASFMRKQSLALLLVLSVFLVVCIRISCQKERKIKAEKIGKKARDYNDVDVEKLLDQWNVREK